MSHPDPFDPEQLKLKAAPVLTTSNRLPRHKPGGKFVHGPIPWDWLELAGRIPGKALLVGLLIWREAGCVKRRTVRLCLARAAALGMHRDTAKRALQGLEEAKLISISRRPGRALDVTLLEAPGRPLREEPAA